MANIFRLQKKKREECTVLLTLNNAQCIKNYVSHRLLKISRKSIRKEPPSNRIPRHLSFRAIMLEHPNCNRPFWKAHNAGRCLRAVCVHFFSSICPSLIILFRLVENTCLRVYGVFAGVKASVCTTLLSCAAYVRKLFYDFWPIPELGVSYCVCINTLVFVFRLCLGLIKWENLFFVWRKSMSFDTRNPRSIDCKFFCHLNKVNYNIMYLWFFSVSILNKYTQRRLLNY